MTRRNPPLPARDRRQSTAVDHVRKFVEDELVIEPQAFLRLGALGRVYCDWCEFHGVMNRRVSANELLLRLERDHRLTTGTVCLGGADDRRTLYGLRGARLRDPALNARCSQGGVGPAWRPIVEGAVPDAETRVAEETDPTDTDEKEPTDDRERKKRTARAYYVEHRAEIRSKRAAARRKARSEGNEKTDRKEE